MRVFSSAVIKRPALPAMAPPDGPARGSSSAVTTAAFAAFVVTVAAS
jgi:hypothetical protein